MKRKECPMTIDESKRVERTRDERIRDQGREPLKQRPKETDFDRTLERSRLASQLSPQAQQASKTATSEAIREAVKREDRQSDERKQEEGEGKEGRDSGQKGEKAQGKVAEQKVIAKGRLKDQGGGGGEGGRQGGFGGEGGRRDVSRLLAKSSVKSVPVDLAGKFAAQFAKSLKASGAGETVIPQQVLNKIVQYVRIGINRKGEKEMQIDLHEKIFRGLKLRVLARGGKVAVHFRTSDTKGREVFEKSKDAIRRALTKKGIDVDEIVVS